MISFKNNKDHVLPNSRFHDFCRDCVQENPVDILRSFKRKEDAKPDEPYVSLVLSDGEEGTFCYGDHWLAISVSRGLSGLTRDMVIIVGFENGKISENPDAVSFPIREDNNNNDSVSARALVQLLSYEVSKESVPFDAPYDFVKR